MKPGLIYEMGSWLGLRTDEDHHPTVARVLYLEQNVYERS